MVRVHYENNDREARQNSGFVAKPRGQDSPSGRPIAKIVASVMSGARVFRGSRSNLIYSLLGQYFRNETNWRFMNYGYAFDNEADAPILHISDEEERFCAHLYHAVASQVDLQGKRLLDIGSGRGGGAHHVHKYLHPATTTGLDRAESAVKFCRHVYADYAGLDFKCGDAMRLPFQAGEFDVVLNVESSHCYPDRRDFFSGVLKALTPGGHFLYTDFNAPGDRACSDLSAVGFEPATVTDITANVIRGLKRDSARREQGINTNFPWGTRRAAQLWAGMPGSWVFRDFQSGAREYIMYCARKPE